MLTPEAVGRAAFRARCGECGEEYEYGPDEILRVEQSPPESFTPHPLFLDS